MFIDLSPLRRHRNFRLLFIGQLISELGSSFTLVALPYHIYHVTKSSLAVGMIGIVQLVPLLMSALLGGALADSFNRRTMLIVSELALAACSLLLALTAYLHAQNVAIIYVLAASVAGLKGFHRPSLEAITPRLVPIEDLIAVSALSSLRGNIGRIGGPAIAGLSISYFGLCATYALDGFTFFVSLAALISMRLIPEVGKTERFHGRNIIEGVKYAVSHKVLMGTYMVDIIAMVFGMPMALFPAIAETYGGAKLLGAFYSAPEAGALLATLLSGWTKKIKRHGAAIICAAAIWGLAIVAFGFCHQLYLALVCLAVAGAADMVSGIFRMTIWNETIPDRIRGRMAGIEMISYMTGPLLGNAEAGLVAARFGIGASVISGGALCVVGVLLSGLLLPKFWNYTSTSKHSPNG